MVKGANTRVELGASIKGVKKWHFILQIGAPSVAAPTPAFPGYYLLTPYVIHYRASEEAKPMELIKGVTRGSGGRSPLKLRQLYPGGSINNSMLLDVRRLISYQILVGNTVADNNLVFAPLSYEKSKKGINAVVRLHNRLPVAVDVRLQLQERPSAQVPGANYSVPPRNALTGNTFLLEPREKKTLLISAKDFGNRLPGWVQLESAMILDAMLAPWKDKAGK